jgi:aminoglycoside phosphotransferase (APT) family kinase protein
MTADEAPLAGGWSTPDVVRVGDTVRRPPGQNVQFVRDLLRQLEAVGFEGAPRYLGADDRGRETFSFIEGDVPTDCRTAVWTDAQLESSARLLRRFHDATAGSGAAGESEVVCHNDFGPWNCVWREGSPVAVIDFDRAAPGDRRDDLGYAAWKFLNLGLVELDGVEQARRLRLFASAYGAHVGIELVAAVERAQARMRDLARTFPEEGRASALELLQREGEWLTANAARLAAGP